MMKKMPKAFSNITRLKILSCLMDEKRNVNGLVKNCGLSQSAVSQHLKKLKDLEVIDYENRGRDRFYKLKNNKFGNISKMILKLMKIDQ